MDEQWIVRRVPGSVAEATARLHSALRSRGITVFATIDHAAAARSAGLEIPDELVVLFGNPAVGTGLMMDDPRAGIDLPMRLLLWDEDGATNVGYRDPVSLGTLYKFSIHAGVPEKLSELMKQLASELETSVQS
ncbi:uncharacterized protein (DUF302 family) [Mycetocola sp. CAN_C7]|uniref:DUF302 domain-containing protein n=1 Tax=Mycetocola sp. CAN_C7 TaxID=2787724 RepID=UPI0018C8F671